MRYLLNEIISINKAPHGAEFDFELSGLEHHQWLSIEESIKFNLY